MMKHILIVLGTVLLTAGIVTAQPTPGTDRQMIDGVVAVVGNEALLFSDVQQQLAFMKQQTPSLDILDTTLFRQTLEEMVNERLVLVRAQEDSINVSEDEITRYANARIQQIIQQLGSEKRLEEAFGMPMQRIRMETHDIIRRQILIQRAQQSRFASLKVTDRDVQEFYRIYKDSLPLVPEQIELQRILLKAKPSVQAKQETIALAKSIIDSLRRGADFASFAQRYSADGGSARNGGDLGFVAPGKFVKEYEEALKKLKINEISEPVESQFGIHIIQLLDRRSDANHSRHILLAIKQPQSQRDSLIDFLKTIRHRALAGEDFATLARTYSEDEETKALGGSLGKAVPDQIPDEMKNTLGKLKDGDITDPLPMQVSATEDGYQIVRLARHIPAHKFDPVDDRQALERYALAYKQRTEYANWVAELRKEIFWEIK